MEVVVVETGACNMASMLAALRRAGVMPVRTTSDAADVTRASHVVVPGVGSFGTGMAALRGHGISQALEERIHMGRPTLLVCIGLQLLALSSEESPNVEGLGIIKCTISHLPKSVRVPQQAWNKVTVDPLCRHITEGYAFFSNSYYMAALPMGWSGAYTEHGTRFMAAIERGAVLACQFHPELSGAWGMAVLKRWLANQPISIAEATKNLKPVSTSTSTRRIIPCLDVSNGRVVKGICFQGLRDAGDPVELAKEYDSQGADELIMLDVSATAESRATAATTVRRLRECCSLPMTVGGGVGCVEDASRLLLAGADKVSINTAAVRDPSLITALADRFGSQCVVLAIDAFRATNGQDQWDVVVCSGKENTGQSVVEWAIRGVALGAGEILLTSFDRDGTRLGYDCNLVEAVSSAITVPVIASGGARSPEHMADVLRSGADAVLAASIFHDGDYTIKNLKEELSARGVIVRPVSDSVAEERDVSNQGAYHSTFNIQCLVPSIDLMKGNAVQLIGGDPLKLEINGGDPELWAKKFRVAGEIAIVDLDAALNNGSNNKEVVRRIIKMARCRIGGGIRSSQSAIEWLDAGAAKVVIGTAANVELLRDLPRDRVIVALDARHGEVVVDGWTTRTGQTVVERIRQLQPYAGGFLVTFVEREGRMCGVDVSAVRKLVDEINKGELRSTLTIAGGITTEADIAALDALGVEAQIGMAIYSGKLSFGDAIAAPLRSDRPDGLFPTIVEDNQGKALGLCYSSRESITAAVNRIKGVYWSRSRGLWVKGESSGATQELLGITLDCDRDSLRFTVRQHGSGFCHRNTRTCFGPVTGLAALETILKERHISAPENSYTKRLFEDPALLQAKLLEEATELSEAESPDHIAQEAADLLYFLLVKCAVSGVSIADIEAVLDHRALKVSRRKGDAKPTFMDIVKKGKEPTSKSKEKIDNLQGVITLRRRLPLEVMSRSSNVSPVDKEALTVAQRILNDVREFGEIALINHAVKLGDLPSREAPYIVSRDQMRLAFENLSDEEQGVLLRTAERIRTFATEQRSALQDVNTSILGGQAGHTASAVRTAGCYAPGGRYPLPSTVLMTVITARVAGVHEVWLASPRPKSIILAAAHVAGADALLCVGGSHAIAAMRYGIKDIVPRCDAIVGPGNRFVTAAKSIIAGECAIDMLAGPSECLVVADDTADASVVAADLIAQAEHDTCAVPILVATNESIVREVEIELNSQLEMLPSSNADTANIAIRTNGYAVIVSSTTEAVSLCNAIAPEHLELHTQDCVTLSNSMVNYGGLFIGHNSAEVLGDYGAGPNHTLPTGGSARSFGGLSVLTFMRVRTWIRIDDVKAANIMISDAAELASMEGLHGHAVAALKRKASDNIDYTGEHMAESPKRSETFPLNPLMKQVRLHPPVIHFAIPKGRMMENILDLMKDAGIKLTLGERSLRPEINLPGWTVKLLKPRNVVEMLSSGTRDVGFAGPDIIYELNAAVTPYFDTKLDPVKIVLAAPNDLLVGGQLPRNRHLLVASEYERVTRKFFSDRNLKDVTLVRTHGATEVFPPEDADCIVDNTATGTTLKANGLVVVETLMTSTTHLCVHPQVLEDPCKRAAIDHVKLLLDSVLNARAHALVEFNVQPHLLETLTQLPALVQPTVSTLHSGAGYAVKVVIKRSELMGVIRDIKNKGGSDLLVTDLKQLVY